MRVPFTSLSKHYLELVMVYNKYWKFILSKCLGFTKQIYKWNSIFFDLCNNPMMWQMKNGARKAMTGHAGGQRAVKKGNWPWTQLSWLLCWCFPSSFANKYLHLPLTQRCREGRKNSKPVLGQIENSLWIFKQRVQIL